jgi:thymidine phosphorylase
LIAASIVSKKIAGGAHAIVYDVKVGRGAFTAGPADGRALAETLVALTRAFGRRAFALVTDMDEPLGSAIGTGLEAIEARDFLGGVRREARLAAVCEALGAALLRVAGVSGDASAALADALASGRAAETFERMLAAQGAETGALASLAPLELGATARAARAGYVTALDAVALGERARDLVVARGSRAGIVLAVRPGESVRAGDALARVHGGDADSAAAVARAFAIADVPPAPRPLVYGEIDAVWEAGAAASSAVAGASESAPRSTLESR